MELTFIPTSGARPNTNFSLGFPGDLMKGVVTFSMIAATLFLGAQTVRAAQLTYSGNLASDRSSADVRV